MEMTIKEFLNPNEVKRERLEILKKLLIFSLKLGSMLLLIKIIPIFIIAFVEVLNIGGPIGGW
jgi:hypothetical protein